MTTLGLLAASILIVAPQFAYAFWLERSLPKRKCLPVWLKNGPHMERRRKALLTHPVLSAGLALCLLVIAIVNDLDDKPVRTAAELTAAFSFAILVFALPFALNCWLLKRWFRKSAPPLR